MPETSSDTLYDVCNRGHELSPDNVYKTGFSDTNCLTCRRELSKDRKNLRAIWPVIKSGAWKQRGLCKSQEDPNFMFPETNRANRSSHSAQRQVCAECPVRAQCFTYGLFEPYGIWGGYTASERAAMRDGKVPIPMELLADRKAFKDD